MSDTFKFVQNQQSYLSGAGCAIGATSITLNNFTKLDGTALTMADFGSKGFGTIEPGNITNEESITFTGITDNGNETYTLTGVKSQMTEAPYTETSGTLKSHSGGVTFIISNTAGFYDALTGKNNDETITGQWTFPSSESARPRADIDTDTAVDEAYVTFGQLGRTAIGGASKATDSVYGIVKLNTAATSGTQPIVIGENEVSTTSGNNKIPRANGTTGLVAGSFIIDSTSSGLETGSNGGTKVKLNGTTLLVGTSGLSANVGTSALQLVQLDSSGKLPAIDGSQLTNVVNHTVISATRDRTATSGSVNYAHGLGVTPKKITVHMITSGAWSYGAYDVGGNEYVNEVDSGSGSYGSVSSQSSGYSVWYSSTAGQQFGHISAVDSTNITITWTKTSSPSAGTLYLIIESEL